MSPLYYKETCNFLNLSSRTIINDPRVVGCAQGRLAHVPPSWSAPEKKLIRVPLPPPDGFDTIKFKNIGAINARRCHLSITEGNMNELERTASLDDIIVIKKRRLRKLKNSAIILGFTTLAFGAFSLFQLVM